jgi:hypothetical protein
MASKKKPTAKATEAVIQRKESSSGFHYSNLFQCCPRKWYFRYLKGWENKIKGRPLILGGAFHEGKAVFYKTGSERKAIQVAHDLVDMSKLELIKEDFDDIHYRVPIMLHYWIEKFGRSDRAEYDFVMIERQLEVPVEGTPYIMTIRCDAVVRTKIEKIVIIFETKTSSFSKRIMEESVALGDQATSYLFGIKKMTGLDPIGVIPDIAYWNKKTTNLSNLEFFRGDVITRSDGEIRTFEKSIGQLFHEMSQKAEAYRQGYDPWILFPRNSHYCTAYSTPCEFAGVCRADCELVKRAPSGFRKLRTIRKIGGYVEDQIGGGE